MTATADQSDNAAGAIADVSAGGAAADAATPGGATTDLVAQLGELLACTSWRLRRAARGELEPLGLTFGQARALRLLARADEPLRMGELAVRLEVVPRSATAMVDALEAAGLVERRADPARPPLGAGLPHRRGRRPARAARSRRAGRAPRRCSAGSTARSALSSLELLASPEPTRPASPPRG